MRPSQAPPGTPALVGENALDSLTDKIFMAFTHAYSAGRHDVADLLRQALLECEPADHDPDQNSGQVSSRDSGPQPESRLCALDLLGQAALWAAFIVIDARDAFKDVSQDQLPNRQSVEMAQARMIEAYRAWSLG